MVHLVYRAFIAIPTQLMLHYANYNIIVDNIPMHTGLGQCVAHC